jgi:hypothetical protein
VATISREKKSYLSGSQSQVTSSLKAVTKSGNDSAEGEK